MLRELITRFNRSLSGRMVAPRRRHTASIKLWFDAESDSERSVELARAACIMGETIDMSRTGVGLTVPAIRSKEKYLVGQQRTLNVEIDLPAGKVYMRMIGVRYEKVGIHISTERFFVGAHIIEISDHDRELYDAFLKTGGSRPRAAATPVRIGIE